MQACHDSNVTKYALAVLSRQKNQSAENPDTGCMDTFQSKK